MSRSTLSRVPIYQQRLEKALFENSDDEESESEMDIDGEISAENAVLNESAAPLIDIHRLAEKAEKHKKGKADAIEATTKDEVHPEKIKNIDKKIDAAKIELWSIKVGLHITRSSWFEDIGGMNTNAYNEYEEGIAVCKMYLSDNKELLQRCQRLLFDLKCRNAKESKNSRDKTRVCTLQNANRN